MMNVNPILAKVAAAGAVLSVGLTPAIASAQSRADLQHRQQQKNTWRNLGIAGAAVGVLGLLKGNSTLTALGLGGGAYSAWRYEQDRKSQSNMERRRAQLFSRSSFNYGGHHYTRKTYWKNGQKYYKFVRS